MTILNIPSNSVSEISTYLRRGKFTFDEIYPSNSLKWLMKYDRDFTGFLPLMFVEISKSTEVFIFDTVEVCTVQKPFGMAQITKMENNIVLSMASEDFQSLGVLSEAELVEKKQELIKVFEVQIVESPID